MHTAFITILAAATGLGVWAAIGLRTGLWGANFLVIIPLLLFYFAVLYAVSKQLLEASAAAGGGSAPAMARYQITGDPYGISADAAGSTAAQSNGPYHLSPASTPPAPRQPGATRTAPTRTTSTPPAPTQSTPPPAPPFWSRSRRRPH